MKIIGIQKIVCISFAEILMVLSGLSVVANFPVNMVGVANGVPFVRASYSFIYLSRKMATIMSYESSCKPGTSLEKPKTNFF